LRDIWHLDEFFVTIREERFYLWRTVDQDGDTLDSLLQRRRDRKAARRLLRKLLKGQGSAPNCLVTDKLGSYRAAHREVIPAILQATGHTTTIGPKSLINPQDKENARCAGSKPLAKPSDSPTLTQPFRTCFESGDIVFARATTGSSGSAPSSVGNRWRPPTEDGGAWALTRRLIVKLTVPE